MDREKKIEQMHKAKIQRWDNSSLGAMVGGVLHDAVAVSIAKLSKEKESLITREDYQKEIEFWLGWLFKTSQDKKDYESIPVSNEPVVYESLDPKKSDLENAKGEEYKGREKAVQEIEKVNNELSEIQGYGD